MGGEGGACVEGVEDKKERGKGNKSEREDIQWGSHVKEAKTGLERERKG